MIPSPTSASKIKIKISNRSEGVDGSNIWFLPFEGGQIPLISMVTQEAGKTFATNLLDDN